jgi:hypothetical protein
MKKIIEVLTDQDYDRYVFLHIDKSKSDDYADGIYGLSFHQGIGTILWEYAEPNAHLTEIWRRLTLNYPNVDRLLLIRKAIEFYVDAYIIQDNVQVIPSSQLALIQKALKYYVEQSAKFNSFPTDDEAYEIFDMQQLSAMMNYPVSITISEEDKSTFVSRHGMDFPTYIY